MSLMEFIKQSGSEKVDDDKDVRISKIRGQKITITITSAIIARENLLMASTKITLSEPGKEDVRVRKRYRLKLLAN